MKLKYFSLPLIALTILAGALIYLPQQAKAVSAADWRAGRIIDDAIFFNKDSMSVQQIQDFLNSKVPNCDRWNPTRFTYAGKPYGPPYTCLKEYQENPITKENNIGRFNPDGSPYNVPGGWSAAQIIKDASIAYNINPQTLIVMLQKETAIVTDTWAAGWQYDRAMGYGCPDSGPNGTANCNTNYYGFYNQVGNAAWQLRRYVTYPDEYNFKAGVTRNILWQVNGVCGSSPVYLENAATAALYNYTPYQPNQAALNNLYGTGDGCSAYGNRNFWRLFNDWFGAGYVPNPNIIISSYITPNDQSPNAMDSLTLSYSVRNKGAQATDTGILWICGSINGKSFGGGSNRKVLAPGESLVISMPYTPTESGILNLTACGDIPGGSGWTANYPYGEWPDHRTRSYSVGKSALVINSYIAPKTSSPRVGELNTVGYSIVNRDTITRDTGVLWICGSINGKSFGGGSNRKVLAPGESLVISMPYTPTESGILNLTACGDIPGGSGWTANYPYGEWPDHRTRSYSVGGSPLLISWAVNHSGSQLTKNVAENLRYAVKNTSTLPTDTGVLWICGSINGKSFGGGSNRKVLAPGEELLISMPYMPTESGNLTVWACGNTPSGPGYVDGYPYGAWLDHRIRSFSVF